jgi:uncharacterized cupin superfamily protein
VLALEATPSRFVVPANLRRPVAVQLLGVLPLYDQGLSVTQPLNSKNAEGVFEPFSVETVPWEAFSRGERFSCRTRPLGEFGGGTHVGVSLEEIPPGKSDCPAHYHYLEEEHLYLLEGFLTLRLGVKSYSLSPGSYVCFPAGQKLGHCISNAGNTVARYLVIGERNPNDVIVYTDSGRVGVRLTGEGYRKSVTMDYWEGEGGA